ncbi:MAG: hypothetical protein WDM79_12870 [Terricaulis sp.]
MKRDWAGIVLVVALIALAAFAFWSPSFAGGHGREFSSLIYLLLVLLLVAGGGYGYSRIRYDGKRALAGIVFWSLMLAAIVVAYHFFK